MSFVSRLTAAVLMLVVITQSTLAQTSEQREFDASIAEAYAKGTAGPASIKLGDVATLALPKDFVFVRAEQARRVMHAMGNTYHTRDFGVVLPGRAYSGWFFAVAEHRVGYVSADAVRSWNSKDVFGLMREATRRGNAERATLGSGRIDVAEFVEPPRYDAAQHRYTVATRIVAAGPSSDDEDSVNLDTHVFGRHSSIEIALVAGAENYATYRAALEKLAAGTAFLPGHRIADVDVTTDKPSEHALAVLFGGRSVADIEAEAAQQKKGSLRAASARTQTHESGISVLAIVFGLLAIAAGAAAVFVFGGERPHSGNPT
jgi:uncharacterized membrane-anchored protein